ncbi:MAG: nucleotidyltransferase domain-containing protein [Patescibacteria group bacterium]
MKASTSLELKTSLILARENLIKKLETLFEGNAVEAHIFGSVARGDADAYSDVDIWFTFKDDEFEEIYKNRLKYYELLGKIVHLHEAPQNAPINGVHTALLIQEGEVITVVDIYLCPISTSYITEEGEKLFGIDVPLGTVGFNPQKITVDKDYRIDFLICFIFGTIKKLARHKPEPLDGVLRQYEHLYKDYGIPVEPLENQEQDLGALETIIENTQKVSNEKQKEALSLIRHFATKILF